MCAESFFYVVIPSYNNEEWCIRNIESVIVQKNSNWKAVIINDCSTDKTGLLLENYIREKKLSHKIQIIHNAKRVGMLANIYRAVHEAKPEWVVCTIDGDDWLLGDTVFTLLDSIYRDPKVWMTYGSWISEPAGARDCLCRDFPLEVIRTNTFRKHPFISSQLRTFYAGLFQKIKKSDLQHDGKFFMAAGDVAFMMPMLEMSSLCHFYYLKEPIYVYNVNNPINDFRINAAERRAASLKIREKKPYKPLKKLDFKRPKS